MKVLFKIYIKNTIIYSNVYLGNTTTRLEECRKNIFKVLTQLPDIVESVNYRDKGKKNYDANKDFINQTLDQAAADYKDGKFKEAGQAFFIGNLICFRGG